MLAQHCCSVLSTALNSLVASLTSLKIWSTKSAKKLHLCASISATVCIKFLQTMIRCSFCVFLILICTTVQRLWKQDASRFQMLSLYNLSLDRGLKLFHNKILTLINLHVHEKIQNTRLVWKLKIYLVKIQCFRIRMVLPSKIISSHYLQL